MEYVQNFTRQSGRFRSAVIVTGASLRGTLQVGYRWHRWAVEKFGKGRSSSDPGHFRNFFYNRFPTQPPLLIPFIDLSRVDRRWGSLLIAGLRRFANHEGDIQSEGWLAAVERPDTTGQAPSTSARQRLFWMNLIYLKSFNATHVLITC